MNLDIEKVMDDIAAILKVKIPLKITEINTEKGDSLLPVPNFSTEPNKYQLWFLNDLPYDISYHQFIARAPEVTSIDTGNADKHYIGLSAIIAEDAEGDMAKKQVRLNRVFEEIINCNLYEYNKEVRIESFDMPTLNDKHNNNVFVVSNVTFSIVLAG